MELGELATPVYWTGTLNLSVGESQAVWRYMDFAKFVAMLQQGGLYFSRADQFDDRFEGATGLASKQCQWEEFYLDYYRKVIVTAPPSSTPQRLSAEQIEREAQRLLQSTKAITAQSRNLLLNCWHNSAIESEALWRLYCPPPTLGVALKANVGRLWDVTAPDATAIVGRVHYLDFKQEFATIQKERIFCKRKSLSHENEVRIVLENDRKEPAVGKWLRCDLSVLIEVAVVSPFAPPWCEEVVKAVISQYGYNLNVIRSELLDVPFY
jgi:hypothetical protein